MIYDFQYNLIPPQYGIDVFNNNGSKLSSDPIIQTNPFGISQSSDIGGRVKILGESPNSEPDYIEEYLMPGLHDLDHAMKMYWSGLRIPTKDSFRMVRTKISGGDRSLMIWKDELVSGRAKLPIATIDRTGLELNRDKFSPPYLAMGRKYLSNRCDRVAKVYRPVAINVEYSILVWTQHKMDAEYVLYQIITKFNPVAEFTMFDGHLIGNVRLQFGGYADLSDKESGPDDQAKVQYEYKMTAEAWLPLAEKIIPTILGNVRTIGDVNFPYSIQKGNPGYQYWPSV